MKAFRILGSALAILALSVFTGCDDDEEQSSSAAASVNYSVEEICSLYNGEVLILPSAYVVAVANGGYIVSDDFSSFIYVSDKSIPSVGDEVFIMGTRSMNSCDLPIILADSHDVISSGNEIKYPSADEISGEVFEYYGGYSWKYVCVSGKLAGTTVTTSYSTTYSVTITDTPEIGLGGCNGSRVNLYGFYAGYEKRGINVIGTSVEDCGTITSFFSDDLEWVAPYAEATGAGDNVATGISTTNAPSVETASGFMDELESRGYELLSSTSSLAVYLQTNYLKFGGTNSTTHAGIILPTINVPEGTDIAFTFDWCPMRGGGLWFDRVQVDVRVADERVAMFFHALVDSVGDNNGGTPLTWLNETVVLENYSPSNRITLRSYPWDVEDPSSYPSGNDVPDFYYLRYFLDNFEICEAY